jgi:hypothetical protein
MSSEISYSLQFRGTAISGSVLTSIIFLNNVDRRPSLPCNARADSPDLPRQNSLETQDLSKDTSSLFHEYQATSAHTTTSLGVQKPARDPNNALVYIPCSPIASTCRSLIQTTGELLSGCFLFYKSSSGDMSYGTL